MNLVSIFKKDNMYSKNKHNIIIKTKSYDYFNIFLTSNINYNHISLHGINWKLLFQRFMFIFWWVWQHILELSVLKINNGLKFNFCYIFIELNKKVTNNNRHSKYVLIKLSKCFTTIIKMLSIICNIFEQQNTLFIYFI